MPVEMLGKSILEKHGRSDANDAAHNTAEEMIANPEPGAADAGHWIKASIAADGKYTVTNSRNGYSKTYTSR